MSLFLARLDPTLRVTDRCDACLEILDRRADLGPVQHLDGVDWPWYTYDATLYAVLLSLLPSGPARPSSVFVHSSSMLYKYAETWPG